MPYHALPSVTKRAGLVTKCYQELPSDNHALASVTMRYDALMRYRPSVSRYQALPSMRYQALALPCINHTSVTKRISLPSVSVSRSQHALPSVTKRYRALPSVTQRYHALLVVTRRVSLQVLQSVTMHCYALPSVTKVSRYQALPSAIIRYQALPSVTMRYQALPSVTKSYHALPSVTNRVSLQVLQSVTMHC